MTERNQPEYSSGMTPEQIEALGSNPDNPLAPLHDAIVNSEPARFVERPDDARGVEQRINDKGYVVPMGVDTQTKQVNPDARRSEA